MYRSFWPLRQRTIVLLGFALLAGLSLGGFFGFSAWSYADQNLAWAFALAAGLAFLIAIAAATLLLRLIRTRYDVLEGGLILRLGGSPVLLPHAKIEWLRPLSDFKDPLPLPSLRLPGYLFGKMPIKSLGLTHFAATNQQDYVLLATADQAYLISPHTKTDFISSYRRNAERYPLHDLYDPAITAAEVWRTILQQSLSRWLLLAGLLLVIGLWALAAVIVSSQAQISWVNLQMVPAVQLFLLPTMATLIWLFNFFAGFLIYREASAPKAAAHWFWAAGVFVPAIFLIAALLMSL